MKRWLITGASGDLGRPLAMLAAQRAEVIGIYYSNPNIGGGEAKQLDLRDQDEVMQLIEAFKPNAIIHTAGSDRSENDTIAASALNLVAAAKANPMRLVVMSTDMVFDGKTPPYSESAHPTPLSLYGRSKAEAEQVILDEALNCVIIRTSLIYDFKRTNRQIGWMTDKIAAGQPIPLFTDEIRNPVFVWNLAEALLELAEHDYCGILNVAGAAAISRYEYGCELLRAIGIEPSAHVKPTQAEVVAPQRPRDLTLDLARANTILKTPLMTMQQARAASISYP